MNDFIEVMNRIELKFFLNEIMWFITKSFMIFRTTIEGVRKNASRTHMQSNLIRSLDWGYTLNMPKIHVMPCVDGL